MRSVSSLRAVSISTGVALCLPARSSRHSCRPSSPGIMMSSTIRSTGVGFEKAAHLPAIGDHGGAQTVLLQVIAHQFADLAVVVDDENVIDMVHRFKPLAKGNAVQSIEPATARLPAFVLQCICRVGGYTGTQKRDVSRVLYRYVSPAGRDT